jgi:hypothetical protein
METIQFFTETEVNKYTLTGKIVYLLDKCVNQLNAIETERHNTPARKSNYDSYKAYKTIFNSFDLAGKNNIVSPFPDVSIAVTDAEILIQGYNFKYAINPKMLIHVQIKFKKIKEL